jgi:hypothetical protein
MDVLRVLHRRTMLLTAEQLLLNALRLRAHPTHGSRPLARLGRGCNVTYMDILNMPAHHLEPASMNVDGQQTLDLCSAWRGVPKHGSHRITIWLGKIPICKEDKMRMSRCFAIMPTDRFHVHGSVV